MWLKSQGKDYKEIRQQAKVLKQQPFSTEKKYMATIAEVSDKKYLLVKGAPEIVLSLCQMEERERNQALRELDEWQHKLCEPSLSPLRR